MPTAPIEIRSYIYAVREASDGYVVSLTHINGSEVPNRQPLWTATTEERARIALELLNGGLVNLHEVALNNIHYREEELAREAGEDIIRRSWRLIAENPGEFPRGNCGCSTCEIAREEGS